MSLFDNFELVLISGSSQGLTFSLTSGINTIGRHSENVVCLDKEGLVVSKRHAVLTITRDAISIEDCGSTNGLFKNGTKVSNASLIEGDVIGFGEKGPRLRLKKKGVRKETLSTDDTVIGVDQVPVIKAESNVSTQNIQVEDKPQMWRKAPFGKRTTDVNMVAVPSKDNTNISAEQSKNDEFWDEIPLPLIADKINDKSNHTSKGKSLPKSVLTTREVEGFLTKRKETGKKLDGTPFSRTQEVLLSKVRKVYNRKNRNLYFIGGSIIVLLCGVAVYYALGYYRYEIMYSDSVAIREKTIEADREFEQLRLNDDIDQGEKEELLQEVRLREQRLDSIMRILPPRYQQRFFNDDIERYLHEIMTDFNEPFYRVPSHVVGKVKFYVEKFRVEYQRRGDILTRWKNDYYPYIGRVFKEQHVPEILAYIAIQESMLDTQVTSHAGARGFWQFIPATGRQYGLVINKHQDDRTDWKKATGAAARYLHDLLAEFGEGRAVLLAIAAYNTGGGNVRRALRNIKDPLRDRDFWYLYRTSNVLADETREYVPQVIARIILDQHRSDFGL